MDVAPEGYRAPLLTLIGWLAYLKGQSPVAGDHFKLALADTPGYRLAELTDQLVSRGTITLRRTRKPPISGTAKYNGGRTGNELVRPLGAQPQKPEAAGSSRTPGYSWKRNMI
ncbi:MAG: DUF4192 family protein, partial [Actinomycetes bacterium]